MNNKELTIDQDHQQIEEIKNRLKKVLTDDYGFVVLIYALLELSGDLAKKESSEIAKDFWYEAIEEVADNIDFGELESNSAEYREIGTND